MTPTRSGRNYSIQSNGYGPEHSSQKSKRQECQPRGEAQMEDARTSNSAQRLFNTFETLIERPEADITAILILDLNHFKQATIEIYQPQYKNWFMEAKQQEWELLPSLWIGTMSSYLQVKNFKSMEIQRTFWGLDTHVLQRTSPTDRSLVEKPKDFVRGPGEEVGPRKGQQPCGSSSSLNKCKKGKAIPKEQ
ncbi:hypothetical protein O181_024905 [Austropuccinia psidii MF-1]|uniref:Uncharacterized protein n=1 Tax=Austropuccinia psidii MF-1 TaxID=1389203 RepID=A0A9Q3CLP2_9BASI|nr:hypothetical protein [Austropuccinia psidii MF-1]